MLVLTRKMGEEIIIDGKTTVKIISSVGGKVRLGITAPSSVTVDRKEVHARKGEFSCDWSPDTPKIPVS